MSLHTVALILLTLAAQSPVFVFPILMLWAFSAWSSGPTQQYHLISLAPEASGIMLSINTSVIQLAMAAGAGIGGIVVEHVSLTSISWIGATGVAVSALTAAISFSLSRSQKRQKTAETSLSKASA
jgi:DHA1 family putative efflux transporter-like MFS transporter